MPKIKRNRLPQNMIKEVNLKYKRNINFLDKPLFIPSRTSVTLQEYSDGKGYKIKCPEGLPVAYDIDLLNFLMYRAQLTWKPELEFKTMRDLIRKLGHSDGKANYDRIERSLDKWNSTAVSFKNHTFYVKGGKRITVLNLSVLTWEKDSENRIVIKIDDDFFNFNMQGYSQVFQVKLMAQLTPYSKRVFELLKKNDTNLSGTDPWKIGFDKLNLKIPTEAPSSKVLWALKNSVDEINRLIPRFGMRYYYTVERDTDNKNNILINKTVPLSS